MRELNKAEIDKRITSLQSKMKESNIDAALIVQNADMYYFSGAIIQGYVFIPCEGQAIHFVNKGFNRAKEESFIENIISLSSPKEVASILTDFGHNSLKVVGLELDVIPFNLYMRLTKMFSSSDIVDISPTVRSVRVIKSAYEIAQIKKAGELSSSVFELVKNTISEGMYEIELLTLIESFSKKNGHSGCMRTRGFNQELGFVLLTSGPESSVPSFCDGPIGGKGYLEGYPHGSSNRKLEKSVPIVLDYEGVINGYKSDMTRTYSIGSLSSKMEEAYEVTYLINEFVKENLKPGVKCSDIYKGAYAIAGKSKHKDFFMGFEKPVPYIGHGLGLEVDEATVIFAKNNDELRENMIIAIEPKFLFEDGAVGIENTFQITSKKPIGLTNFDENIIRI